MKNLIWGALLVVLGYTLGASGLVQRLWDGGHSDGAQEPGANPSAFSPAPAAVPIPASATDSRSVEELEYSYQRPHPDQLVTARVLSITDGDTFRALIGAQNVAIRMADYDAPERDQPYGREATAELAALLASGGVQLENRGDGGFGRTAARVFVGEVDVNFEMVKRGAGWFDPEYAQDEELYLVENVARDARIGLWALPLDKRLEPWVWRRLSKEDKALRRVQQPSKPAE
jgi:micrococcal nuclease